MYHKTILQLQIFYSLSILSDHSIYITMGVITLENEFLVAVSPAKLFKAYCLDTDILMPKILPEYIKSSEIIEGNGGAGTVRKITFVEGKCVLIST